MELQGPGPHRRGTLQGLNGCCYCLGMDTLKGAVVALLLAGCAVEVDPQMPDEPEPDEALEQSGIEYRGPYRPDEEPEDGVDSLADAGAPVEEAPDASAEPVEPEPVEPEPPEEMATPIPVSTLECDGALDDIELRYRVTVYDTAMVMAECWETLGRITLFGKFVMEPGDEGHAARACSIRGDREWTFGTSADDGVLSAYAEHRTLRVALDCVSR